MITTTIVVIMKAESKAYVPSVGTAPLTPAERAAKKAAASSLPKTVEKDKKEKVVLAPSIEAAKPPRDELSAIVEELSHEHFTGTDVVNFTVKSIERGKELMQQLGFPYDVMYRYVGPLFDYYLEHKGISAEMSSDDLVYIIREAISEDPQPLHFNWQLFLDKLKIAEHLPPPKGRELYLNKVCNAQKLAQIAEFGFVDHRLEHAVTTIQRLFRYGRSNPLASSAEGEDKGTSVAEYKAWYQQFEDLHHRREEHWKKHCIHVGRYHDIKNLTMDEAETSVIHWNKHVIFPYIMDTFKRVDPYHPVKNKQWPGDLTIKIDIEVFIGVELESLHETKRARILRLIGNNITHDFDCKLDRVLDEYNRGRLDIWRNARINGLKFLEITGVATADNQIQKQLVRTLFSYPLAIIERVVAVTDKCTALWGRRIMAEFVTLNIERLSDKELIHWFLQMTIDPLEDLVKDRKSETDSQVTVERLRLYLNSDLNPESASHVEALRVFERQVLNYYQKELKEHRNPYPQMISYITPKVTMITI